jgi:hypothetical protein
MTDYKYLFECFNLEINAARKMNTYPITIKHNPPATHDEITDAQSRIGNIFPDLIMYFNVANGSIFGEEIVLSTREIWEQDGFLYVHNWGNGDHTAISVSQGMDILEYGAVYFLNHSHLHAALIAPNLAAWFVRLANEVIATGGVAHPLDYIYNKTLFRGCYSGVISQLRNTDCELQRYLNPDQ